MKTAFLLALTGILAAPVLAQPQDSTLGIAPPAPELPAPEAPIAWKNVLGVDGKPLAAQVSGGFKVELRAGAWCRVKQFYPENPRYHIPQSNFDHEGFAGFAIQPRLFDRDGKLIEDPYPSGWSGQIKLDNGESAGGSWEGDKSGGIYFGGLTPYAKKGTIELAFADPKRPPEAEGRFETSFLFADLPYPTEVNTFLPVNKVVETPHGSKITLLGYGRYEPGLLLFRDGKLADAGIYFFVKEVKPKAFKDADLSVGNFKVGAIDGKIGYLEKDDLKFLSSAGGDLREGKGYGDNSAENQTYIFAAPDTPRLLHLQLKYRESHPSWKQNQYFHSVSFPFDFRGYAMPTRDAKFAPIATAKNADVEVALDLWQDRSFDKVKRRYLAWFWTRDLKIKDDPSLRWIIQGGATRPGTSFMKPIAGAKLSDGGTIYSSNDHFAWSESNWRFRPDGSPVLGSEYRPALAFYADALQGQPQKWDMKVTFAQWRLKKHDWNWKAVPVPPLGQQIAVNRVAISPTGLKIKLLNVAAYDAAHQFAGIEGGFGETLSKRAQGVAFSFETELAQFPKPKAFDNKELQADVIPSPGPDWDLSSGGDHDQISGQKSTPQILRWTKIFPLEKLEANSFDLDLSWEANYPTGRTATFDFPNLPTPAKDTR